MLPSCSPCARGPMFPRARGTAAMAPSLHRHPSEAHMQTTKRPTDDVRHQIQVLVSELETLRDESKVQAHLAKMDLHDRWIVLQKRHSELSASVRSARDEALESLRASLVELRDGFRKLHEDAGVDPEC